MNRLRWHCRRGMLELDALLQSFVEDGYRDLDPSERQAFLRLLKRQDLELFEWLSGREEPPADLRFVVERLRSCKVRLP
ncbi:MAG: FAD assembly factor SdhE [Thiobacillaceae bacterium]